MNIIEALNWRYAAKKMIDKEVSKEKLDVILEAIRLAPTSLGLQVFKVFVITDKELKNEIFSKAAKRQEMIPNCSHLLVFAASTNASSKDVEVYAQVTSEIKGIPLESLSGLKAAYGGFLDGMSDAKKTDWSARQTYIAMSYATVAAAALGVDCTPVEGFDPSKVDEILDLKNQNLASTLLLPLGYRDEAADYLANAKKIRKNADELFVLKN